MSLTPGPSPAQSDQIPAHLQEALAAAIVMQHSGPLPAPALLRDYDNVVPGAAERILQMAEREQHHRQSMERSFVLGKLRLAEKGQIFGLIIAIVGLVGAVLSIHEGHDTAGATFGA